MGRRFGDTEPLECEVILVFLREEKSLVFKKISAIRRYFFIDLNDCAIVKKISVTMAVRVPFSIVGRKSISDDFPGTFKRIIHNRYV